MFIPVSLVNVGIIFIKKVLKKSIKIINLKKQNIKTELPTTLKAESPNSLSLPFIESTNGVFRLDSLLRKKEHILLLREKWW